MRAPVSQRDSGGRYAPDETQITPAVGAKDPRTTDCESQYAPGSRILENLGVARMKRKENDLMTSYGARTESKNRVRDLTVEALGD
ncbi:hypothetical protein JCM9957A_27870 [Kineosporia succinea]